jgi:photosystem II stability/assembly factor-like uncharacterized protein
LVVLDYGDYGNFWVYISTDNGDSWIKNQLTKNGDPGRCAEFCINDESIYHYSSYNGTQESGFFVTHDLGKTWNFYNGSNDKYDAYYITNFKDKFYISTEFALSVVENNKDSLKTIFMSSDADVGIGPAVVNDSIILFNTNIHVGIFKSTDSGKTWKNPKSKLLNDQIGGYGLTLVDNKLLIVLGSVDKKLCVSNDFGDTWSVQSDLSKYSYFNNLTVCNKFLYASNKTNLLFSSDYGISWETYVPTNGMISGDVYMSKITINDDYIYLSFTANSQSSNFYGGIYRAKLKDCKIDFSSEVKGEQDKTTEIFSLNPVTDFIEINQATNQPILIYSVLGIKLLETEFKDKIDVSSLTPGMYFVRIGDRVRKFVKL